MREYIITYEEGKESEVFKNLMFLDITVEKVIKATSNMIISTDMFRQTRLEKIEFVESVERFETE